MVPVLPAVAVDGSLDGSARDLEGVTVREVTVTEVFSEWSDEQREGWQARGTDPGRVVGVRLQERNGSRCLDIYVGTVEATAIQLALAGEEPPRPLTHDLFAQTLDLLGANLIAARIVEQRDNVYYAELQLASAAGHESSISARPSDAINVALRLDKPIFVADELLNDSPPR